jgi:hypothetical protein
MFGQSAIIEGGNAYLDMMDNGYDHATASNVALGVGLVNGILETAGVGKVAKPFKSALFREAIHGLEKNTAGDAFGRFVREYATAALAESGTEAGQQIVTILGDELARSQSRPDLPSRLGSSVGRAQAFGEVADAFMQSLMSMSVLSIPGPMAHYVANTMRAGQANVAQKFMEDVAKIDSKTGVRAPDALSAFVAATADGKVESVYVDGKKLDEVLRQTGSREAFAKDLPDVFRQIDDAIEDGDNVAIPIGDYVAKVARSDLHAALMPHAKLSADAASIEEAETFRKEAPELFAEAEKEANAARKASDAFRESGDKLEAQFVEELKATGRKVSDPKKAKATATLYRVFADVQASRLEITPEEFHKRYPVRFSNKAASEDALRQFAGENAYRAPRGHLEGHWMV